MGVIAQFSVLARSFLLFRLWSCEEEVTNSVASHRSSVGVGVCELVVGAYDRKSTEHGLSRGGGGVMIPPILVVFDIVYVFWGMYCVFGFRFFIFSLFS